MKYLLLTLFIISCKSGTPLSDKAEVAASHQSTLFDENSLLMVTLKAPLKTMFDAKENRSTYDIDLFSLDTDPPWYKEAFFGISGSKNLHAKVRVRGGVDFNCPFPPIKLKIDRDEARSTIFEGFKAFKLGTHCKSQDEFRAISAREDALYKIYAVFSKINFRSRFLNTTYIDSETGTTIREPGLLLEDPQDVGDHIGGLDEFKLSWLEQAIAIDDAKYQNNQRSAMLQTLRLEAIRNEREKLKIAHVDWNSDAIEKELKKRRDEIWRKNSLPGFLDDPSDAVLADLFNKLDAEFRQRRVDIQQRQNELKGRIDNASVSRILAFEILALNTDWNVFGAQFLERTDSAMGGAEDNIKNAKLLQDKNGNLFPLPYDLDQSAVYSSTTALEFEYRKGIAAVLANANEHTLPTKKGFIFALNEVIKNENKLEIATSNSHLETADISRLMEAIHVYVKVAKELATPSN